MKFLILHELGTHGREFLLNAAAITRVEAARSFTGSVVWVGEATYHVEEQLYMFTIQLEAERL